MTDPEELLRARRNGRSWTEIAERFHVTVAQAKAMIAPLKTKARDAVAVANTLASDRLTQKCMCRHAAHEHGTFKDHTGVCSVCGPVRLAYQVWDDETLTWKLSDTAPYAHSYREEVGCNAFEKYDPIRALYAPNRKKSGVHTQILNALTSDARKFDRQQKIRRRYNERRAEMQAKGTRTSR